MNYYYLITLFIITSILSYILNYFTLKILRQKQLLDKPNLRSNHIIPTPRGGGIAIILIIIFTISLLPFITNIDFTNLWPIIWCVAFLAIVSFIDDAKGLAAIYRFSAHIAAVCMILSMTDLSFINHLTGISISNYILYPFIGVLFVWYINLYNFMDGIDGITSIQTICNMIAIFILTLLYLNNDILLIFPVIITAAILGFLIFNFHPAKMFMGDVGSIPLGFISFYLLLKLAASGNWHMAVIIPLYYLIDSGITITRRALNKEKIWQAHSKHAYQLAVRKGLSPIIVTNYIIILNIINFCYIMLITNNIISLCIAIITTIILYLYFIKNTSFNS
jgi:UDP-N-acetylmuramyl pentapeptide phosphotransferase/UDP-N-acetylglucosamine-1-phosphate transferase